MPKKNDEETAEIKEEIVIKEDTKKVEESVEDKEVRKEKRERDIEAKINIYTSFNNTLVHATDMSGRTISKITGGMTTKQARLRANPTVAMFIAKRIAEALKENKVTNLYVMIRAKTGNPAPGPGASAIIKSLTREGFRIVSITDTTRVARGGPKKQGGRRGRRV
ncbi:30S ribosomal protein S11 [Candidatus Pacearchaeota archaeon CG10_big_fil_rev_8_21_14_0_10_32_14]|nr:MAG: 30S ribosomal protein S11 [Candidatus Pacearchaeota archaeon CG10_big_fil_rev_8_21_14_0_10_32_14]